MKSTIIESLFLAAAAAPLSLAPTANVSAHGISASTGMPATGSNTGCFFVGNGAVQNNCTSAQNFSVPLMVDSGGSKGATFSGKGVTCQLIGTDQLGQSFSFSTSKTIPGSAVGTASTSVVTVATAGRLNLDCTINPSGQLININYSN